MSSLRGELTDEPVLALYEAAVSGDTEPDPAEILGDGARRYTVLSQIGEGGWKRVSLAHDLVTGRDVAMNVPRKVDSPRQIQRFLHEGRILARLEHAAILRLYDLGLDVDGVPFFVTKYVDGKTLDAVIRGLAKGDDAMRAQWPLFRRLELFNQICAGVSYAHGRGVIHRDLKPDNVLIDQYGQVLVCDWGLARLSDADEHHEPLLMDVRLSTAELRNATQEGVVKGTPGFMAPEQALGEDGQVTKLVDVYALGAILYTLLVYKPAIADRDFDVVRRRTIEGDFASPTAARPDLQIPGGLSAIAMKALATKPEDRYASVAELMADVAAFTAGFAPGAQRAGWATQAMLFARRHRTALLASASGLALAGAMFAVVVKIRHDNARREAMMLAEQVTLAQSLEETRSHAEEAAAWVTREKELRQRYAEDAAVFIVENTVVAYKRGDFETAFSQLEAALSLSQTNERMWRIKTLLHMAKFEIDEAIAAGNHPTDSSFDHQINIPRRFADRQEPEHYFKLFETLHPKHDPAMWRASAVLYPPTVADLARRYAVRAYLLARLNPKQKTWDPLYREAEGGGYAVDLRGHRQLTDVTPVLGSDVVELDLRGTGVRDWTYLRSARHIKRVLLTSQQAAAAKLGDRAVILPDEPRPPRTD